MNQSIRPTKIGQNDAKTHPGSTSLPDTASRCEASNLPIELAPASDTSQPTESNRSDNLSRPDKIVWRLAFWLTVTLLVILMLATMSMVSPVGPTASAIPFFSALTTIAGIIGVWVGLGSAKTRWAVGAIAPAVLAWLITKAIRSTGEMNIFAAMTYLTTGLVALTTGVLRLTKGNLKRVDERLPMTDGLQFGIKDLMIWTTTIAIVFAIGRGLVAADFHVFRYEFMFVGSLALGVAASLVINVWAFLSIEMTSEKLLVVIVMTFAAAAMNLFTFDDAPWFFATVIICCQVFAAFLLLCIRGDGYRFTKTVATIV